MTFDYIDIVKQIVLKHIPKDNFAVFLFGSRAVGNAKPLSDIDIGILGPEPLPTLIKADLETDLEESIVPYKIDLIDYECEEALPLGRLIMSIIVGIIVFLL